MQAIGCLIANAQSIAALAEEVASKGCERRVVHEGKSIGAAIMRKVEVGLDADDIPVGVRTAWRICRSQNGKLSASEKKVSKPEFAPNS